ncbi:MFS transporter [Amycolatopsis mongoliensis]|uniref:MFS transporter n=1 Tax=Amycolatopsis mongoliensis TaxID=715475 RepID=A0A9Y2NDR6_9PSEU|nr:MFS transporter [Amycolatopsis sp. 4-36]WIY00992.1 MFS transporter [Amycolatopsis sp. 4-36]
MTLASNSTSAATGTDSAPELNLRLTGQAVDKWFVTRYVLALAGLWTALLTPASVTLAIRVGQLNPEGKAGSLAVVASVGAFAALIANPVFGALSDHSTSRFGQRRPFIAGGFLLGALATIGIGFAPSIAFVAISWAAAQLAFNAAVAALIAVLPERVPARLRGRVAGFMGMVPQFGVVGGTFLIQFIGTAGVWMFFAPAVIGLVLVLPFVLTLRETPRSREQVGRLDWRVLAGALWINPLKHRDYALAWAGRFLAWIALYLLTTYKTYYLIDKLGYTTKNVASILFDAMLVLAVCVAISSVGSGWLSDRIGRRKPFVVAGSLLFTGGMLVVAFGTGIEHFLLGIAISGLAQGLYLGVDYALIADVLPDQNTAAAKGMGVFNLAGTIPQTLAPVLAPALLAIGAGGGRGNYTAMYLFAAVFALVSAAFIQLIRGVK